MYYPQRSHQHPQHQQRQRHKNGATSSMAAPGGEMTKWNSCPRSLYYKELALHPRRHHISSRYTHIYQVIGTGIVATASFIFFLYHIKPIMLASTSSATATSSISSSQSLSGILDAIAGSAGLSAGVYYFLSGKTFEIIMSDWIEPLVRLVYRVSLFWIQLQYQIITTLWTFVGDTLLNRIGPPLWSSLMLIIGQQQASLEQSLYQVLGSATMGTATTATTLSSSTITASGVGVSATDPAVDEATIPVMTSSKTKAAIDSSVGIRRGSGRSSKQHTSSASSSSSSLSRSSLVNIQLKQQLQHIHTKRKLHSQILGKPIYHYSNKNHHQKSKE